MLRNYSVYIFIVTLFIFGVSIGFFAGRMSNRTSPISSMLKDTESPRQEQEQIQTNNLFSSQTASLRAHITGVRDQGIVVKNLNSNATGTIRASDRLTVFKPGTSPQHATTSAALSNLELNKEVLITAEMADGQYQAVSIQYTLPSPSLPPLPSLKLSPQPAASSLR